MKTQTKSSKSSDIDSKISIIVKGDLSGVSVELKVSPDELVENVKKMAAAELPGLYGLEYGCGKKKDTDILSRYRLKNGGKSWAWSLPLKTYLTIKAPCSYTNFSI
jgi:hypothetical protein